jgi:hypothetical protein
MKNITFEGFVKTSTGGGCEAMIFQPSNMKGMNFIASDEAAIPKGDKVTIGIEGDRAGLVMAIEIDFKTRTIKGLEIA